MGNTFVNFSDLLVVAEITTGFVLLRKQENSPSVPHTFS